MQGLAAPCRGEAGGVDTAPPPEQARDAARGQVLHGGGGRGEGAVTGQVQCAGPRPGGVGHQPHPVGGGESGHVGLVDGHRGHVEGAGGGGPGGAEDERGGQVHHVGPELAQGVVDARAGGADREGGDHRDAHGGDPVDGEAEVVVALGGRGVGAGEEGGDTADERVGTHGVGGTLEQSHGAGRRDHQAVVPVAARVLEDTQDRVGDPVDVREERFGDDGYAHLPTVAHPGHGRVSAAGRYGEIMVPSGEPSASRRDTAARRAARRPPGR